MECHNIAFRSGRGDQSGVCPRCSSRDDIGDLRTLSIACLYDLKETNVPWQEVEKATHMIRVCKGCRADFIGAIRAWYSAKPKQRDGKDSGIYIMDDGATTEVTEKEWYAANPLREPVRVKRD